MYSRGLFIVAIAIGGFSTQIFLEFLPRKIGEIIPSHFDLQHIFQDGLVQPNHRPEQKKVKHLDSPGNWIFFPTKSHQSVYKWVFP